MDAWMGFVIGIGLAAACGFRVFVPLLGVSLASLSGHLELANGFDWMATRAAVIGFATATVLEIGAFYIPWLDNLLDVIATPAAVIAGTIATASMVVDVSPFMKWSLALIAGGGVAGTIQGTTAFVRGAATGTTGGVANPFVSTLEVFSSIVMTILAVVVPFVGAILAILTLAVCIMLFRKVYRVFRRRPAEAEASG